MSGLSTKVSLTARTRTRTVPGGRDIHTFRTAGIVGVVKNSIN